MSNDSPFFSQGVMNDDIPKGYVFFSRIIPDCNEWVKSGVAVMIVVWSLSTVVTH